jgi:hypothetical protein
MPLIMEPVAAGIGASKKELIEICTAPLINRSDLRTSKASDNGDDPQQQISFPSELGQPKARRVQ